MVKIEKIPKSIRWILFLPLAILAFMAGNFLYTILRVTFELTAPVAYTWAADGAAILMGSAINGFLLVWAGVRVAPKFKLQVGIGLTALYGLIIAFLIYAKFVGGMGDGLVANSWFEIIVNLIAGIGGAIIAIQVTAKDDYKRNGALEIE